MYSKDIDKRHHTTHVPEKWADPPLGTPIVTFLIFMLLYTVVVKFDNSSKTCSSGEI